MYVNMHELANLAASRAQEMQLPLPPPPASLTTPSTDKVLKQERQEEIKHLKTNILKIKFSLHLFI